MAGPWLVDGNRFATKIRSASGPDPGQTKWKSNPSRTCPNCQCIIDNDDVAEEWPGLPRGVKFDPTEQEIIHHLLAKAGIDNMELHPFIDEFIPTVNEEDGICYTHPRNLPGVKQDGSAAHFFHRSIKAYNTGTRKRRKIHGDNLGDVRWHKTGRTRPVMLDGLQRGCKKIMVLYVSNAKGGKAEKTNWVMHQYHLGTEEDEKEGEFVISKVFHQQLQQQQLKQTNNNVESVSGVNDDVIVKVDPVTPKSVTPDPPRNERRQSSEPIKVSTSSLANAVGQDHSMQFAVEIRQPEMEAASIGYQTISENHINQARLTEPSTSSDEDPSKSENHIDQVIDHENNQDDGEEPKWWESESQYLIDSQQLVEGLSLCDDLLQSQSPNRNENDPARRNKPGLSDYALLGPDDLKKDLEECQNLVLDPANIDLDTPPDFRLSQLDFGSQESFLAWGGGKVVD